MEREAIKEAVKEALGEELKSFYIDRETHYKQHQWLKDVMVYCEQCKSVMLKTLITIIVGGAIGLMMIGFTLRSGK